MNEEIDAASETILGRVWTIQHVKQIQHLELLHTIKTFNGNDPVSRPGFSQNCRQRERE